MAIGLSHGGTTIYSSPTRSDELLVGTAQGVATLERVGGGSSWRLARRSLPDCHIRAILVEPESGLIFAGGFGSSIHVSSDGGRTWERRSEGLSEDDVWSLGAASVTPSPQPAPRGRWGGVRVYAGTEPARLFQSDDLGQRWSELPGLRRVPQVDRWTFPGPPHVAHLKHINFDPDDAATVYASVEVGGLLKSSDAGQTWQELHGFYRGVQQGTPVEDVHRTVIDPQNGKRMHVVGGEGLCLWMTSDGGASWEQLTDADHEIGGYPDCLVLHPRQPELMFIAAAASRPSEQQGPDTGTRISRSRDGGRTWEALGGGLPERMAPRVEALALEDWGDSFSVFAGTAAGEVYASDDGGEHWSLIIEGIAPIAKGGRRAAAAA